MFLLLHFSSKSGKLTLPLNDFVVHIHALSDVNLFAILI